MEPIVVKSQIVFKSYLNFNFYILLRKPIIKVLGVIILAMIVWVFYSGGGRSNYMTVLELLGFYIVFFPLVLYFSVVRNFKKIKTISEVKTYIFNNEDIQLNSESINLTTKWTTIERAKERKNDFLLYTSNARAIHYLPKSGFANEADIVAFRELVRSKGIKQS